MRSLGTGVIQIVHHLKFSFGTMRKMMLNSHLTRTYSVTTQCGSINISNKVSPNHNEVKIFPEDEMIRVVTEKGSMKYPWLWLRDNCQCKLCFNPQMQSRTIDWKYFNTSIYPKSYSGSNDLVNIIWSDGHESQYSLNWLQEREFNGDVQDKWLKNVYRLPQEPWNANNFPQYLKRFKYRKVIESDEHLLQWLECLATFGIALVEDASSEEDQLRKLANRVAFIKKTHYGEEFVVRNKPDTTNLAYLAIPLQMHTDMPYYDYKPGVNMLHCLEQTAEGGENQFTDCLHLSQLLKKTQPEIYKVLSSIPVEWSDIGSDGGDEFHTIYRAPVICEDQHGSFIRVNYNQWQRDSHFSVPLETVRTWYKANAIFTQALYNPKNMIQLKTKPGEIVTFDNIRLVHGRSGYNDTANNERHIIGSYLDWDVVYSRIRVLRNQVKK